MMNDKPPTIFGDGEQSRDFTFVANVVHANLLAVEADAVSGIAMNSACHQRITLNELVRSINEILKKTIKPIYKDERTGDVKHSFAKNDLASQMIHYTPLVKFHDGLETTINYFSTGL
jgi:UDP-glucose 4-epimerase